jgi:ferredoxin/flavodoxin
MSSTDIFYFSGTGNSLVVAKDLAATLQGNLISIASVIGSPKIQSDADRIGVVFPVYFTYLGGVPFIVQDFVRKLEGLESKYVFAVCTHGGLPGGTLDRFNDMVEARGGRLAAGFTVRMGISIPTGLKLRRALFHQEFDKTDPRFHDAKQQDALYAGWAIKRDVISDIVARGEHGTCEVQREHASALVRRIFIGRYKLLAPHARDRAFRALVNAADESFRISEQCTGCGICASVCPVRNIVMVGERPEWQHRCENCLACYQWCPCNAIGGEIVAYDLRYHHPDVKLADIRRGVQGRDRWPEIPT